MIDLREFRWKQAATGLWHVLANALPPRTLCGFALGKGAPNSGRVGGGGRDVDAARGKCCSKCAQRILVA